jgi:hypothetical protein
MRKLHVSRLVASGAFLLLLPVAPLGWLALAQGSSPSEHRGGIVHGVVRAGLGEGEGPALSLPGFPLLLQDAQTGSTVDTALVGRDGTFQFHRQRPGRYRLCWREEGWEAGCLASEISLGDEDVYTDEALPRPAAGRRLVTGRILLADGSVPGLVDPVFGVDLTPRLRIAGLSKAVPVAADGRFVAAAGPGSDHRLEIQIGTDNLEVDLGADTAIHSTDHPPAEPTLTIVRGLATASGPGATLSVQAAGSDPDGDRVEFHWAAAAGSLSSGRGEAVQWTLPVEPGTYALYLLAGDGRGGFSRSRLNVRADATGVHEAASCLPIPCPGCPPWSGSPDSPFLTRRGSGSEQQALAYYKAVDPQAKRTTLGAWWAANGFDAAGGGGVRASYLNHNDLGFGRDMHCLKNGGNIACYVTNYGCGDQNPDNADRALAAKPGDGGATVTMELSTVEGGAGPKIVKFFAYQGAAAGAPRVTKADLDAFGLKLIPQLCLNCHGGRYNPANPDAPTPAEVDMKSSFREFDLPTFRYPKKREYPDLSQAELNAFKQLNALVAETEPANGIRELIQGWYAGGGNKPDLGWSPPGWLDQSNPAKKALYHQVVATSCRTCHLAFRSSPLSSLDWHTYASFQKRRYSIKDTVCSSLKDMPHAMVTYKNFWLSQGPHRPAVLAAFKASDWPAFGACQ